MRRGEIWLGNLNPNRGAEIGKIRPVLIVQWDFLIAQGDPTIIVLPLTTQVRASKEPLHVTIVGIAQRPDELLDDTSGLAPQVYFFPAFGREHGKLRIRLDIGVGQQQPESAAPAPAVRLPRVPSGLMVWT